jgi:hypothetical protein
LDWINLADDRDKWQALGNVVKKPFGSVKRREFFD